MSETVSPSVQEPGEPPALPPLPEHPTPRTQKARGVIALRKWGNYSTTVDGVLIQHEDDVLCLPDDQDGDPETAASWEGKFGRPCPPRPEHGFVESRVVKGREDVRMLLREAQQQFPEAELLITPFVEAGHSAVATPTIVSVGPGHEGATGGHHAIRFAYPSNFAALGLPLEESGVVDTPYLEVVYRKGTSQGVVSPTFVQLRDGPALPLTKDFIPARITVTRVEVAEGDLIAWGKRVVTLAKEPGVVVTHVGGSLASHFGVHCMSRGVPIVTSREVTVGEVLEKEVPKPLDFSQVKRGLLEGFAFEFTDPAQFKAAITLALLACHGLGVNEAGENSRLFGVGIAFLLRVSWALGIGESRYCKTSALLSGELAGLKGEARQTVYKKALMIWDVNDSRRLAIQAAHAFRHGQFSGGYGGIKWFACLWCTFKVDTAVRTFLATPTDASLNLIRRWVNHTINQAHNNGWWYNKLLQHEILDQASTANPQVLWPLLPFIYEVLATPQVKVVQPQKWKALPPTLTDVSPLVAALGGKVETVTETVPVGKVPALPTSPDPSLVVQMRPLGKGQVRIQWKGPGAPGSEHALSPLSAVYSAFEAFYTSVPQGDLLPSTAGTAALYVALVRQGCDYGFTWKGKWYTMWTWTPALAEVTHEGTSSVTHSHIPTIFLAEIEEGATEELAGEVESVTAVASGESWLAEAEEAEEEEEEEDDDE